MLLLLSGRPGAGKSEVATWLATHQGFHAVEFDRDYAAWDSLLTDGTKASAVEVATRMRSIGDRVVFEWGFPPRLLPRIGQLRDAGFIPWWFDGDDDALWQSYVRRRGNNSQLRANYEGQVAAIKAKRRAIAAAYRSQTINTVGPGPTYLPPEMIARQLVGPEDWQ